MSRFGIYRSSDGVTEAVWDRDVLTVLDSWDDAELVGVVEDDSALLLLDEESGVHELHFAARGHSASEVLDMAAGVGGLRVLDLEAGDAQASWSEKSRPLGGRLFL